MVEVVVVADADLDGPVRAAVCFDAYGNASCSACGVPLPSPGPWVGARFHVPETCPLCDAVFVPWLLYLTKWS